MHGGGHAAYNGNEVWAFDINNSLWEKMYEPTPDSEYIFDPNYPGAIVTNGLPFRPMSRHTYDQIEFLQHKGGLFIFSGVTHEMSWVGVYPNQSSVPSDSSTYNLDTNE